MTTVVLVLIAALAGIAVAFQGQAMGGMNQQVGTPMTMSVTYGTGAILSLIVLLAARPKNVDPLPVPWYGWSAGALGLIIVGGIGYAAPRLGLTRTLVLTVAAQLGAALLIEKTGLFGATPRPFDVSTVCGACLTVLGVWLVVR